MKSLLPVKCVPEKESWRLGLLDALLHERGVLEKDGSQAQRWKKLEILEIYLCYFF